MDPKPGSELPISASSLRHPSRFQVIVEYAAGVCVATAVAESADEAVQAFLSQSPGCQEGEIALFDRTEQRIVASVKWVMCRTEIGLSVMTRRNVFNEWHLALIAWDFLDRATLPKEFDLAGEKIST